MSTEYPVPRTEDQIAWQKAMDLVADVYSATECFPGKERVGLTDQMRRAAVSIPSNVAEGLAHFNKREFRHFLRHARGSLAELETQTLIAERVKYLDETQSGILLKKVAELGRILSGLIPSLEE